MNRGQPLFAEQEIQPEILSNLIKYEMTCFTNSTFNRNNTIQTI